SKIEQEVVNSGPNKNVLGDFSSRDDDLSFTLDNVDLLIGSRFKQRYARKIGDDYYLLTAQWNVETKEWVKYFPKNDWWAVEGIYPEEWNKRPASNLCEPLYRLSGVRVAPLSRQARPLRLTTTS
ncbi:hypothetical protein LCGC14_2546200, partial [marine sediment metagenome]